MSTNEPKYNWDIKGLDRPLVKYNSELLKSLQVRYHATLVTVFGDSGFIERDNILYRPSDLPEHVFDCEDGLRLVCGHYKKHDMGRYLLISSSLIPFSSGWHRFFEIEEQRGRLVAQRGFLKQARVWFRKISGDTRPMKFGGYSHGRTVAYWFIPGILQEAKPEESVLR